MIGDTLTTKYFGRYVERRDCNNLPKEFVGTVAVYRYNGKRAAYLFTDTDRYDLPAFMQKYNRKQMVILARQYQKQVDDRIYKKLCIISAREFAQS